MSVIFEGGMIRLAGECGVEQAEALAGLIAEHPGALVDVSQCRLAHGAVLQVLLSFRPALHGDFADEFLLRWVQPALAGADDSGGAG
jgi:hypothetical protein